MVPHRLVVNNGARLVHAWPFQPITSRLDRQACRVAPAHTMRTCASWVTANMAFSTP